MPSQNPNLPKPQYEYKTREITKIFKQGIREVKDELNRLDVTDLRRAQAQATIKNVGEILKQVDDKAAEWVKTQVPEVAEDGVERTLVSTGTVETFKEAKEIVKFNRLNRELVEAVIADTQEDLLQVTQNVNRKTKTQIRKAVSEVNRGKLAKGVTGTRSISKEQTKKIREVIDRSVDRGIVDAGGKRWRPDVYAEMVTKTKLREAHTEAATNEALDREVMYAIISSHGAIDPCRNHEGRLIKLVPEAEGSMPTYDELRATDHIFHPNCLHVVNPIRNPEMLPEDVKQKAIDQDKRGRQAAATGKRYPSDGEISDTNVRDRNVISD